jgi:hypothetical protein
MPGEAASLYCRHVVVSARGATSGRLAKARLALAERAVNVFGRALCGYYSGSRHHPARGRGYPVGPGPHPASPDGLPIA